MSVLLVIALVLGMSSFVAAHDPPGELFFMVQFPDNAVPTIDGDFGDWSIVPDNPYAIGQDKLFDPAQFQQAGRGQFDPSDINIRHRMGWNDSFNKIYFATEIFDNVHSIDRADPARHWYDDNWEVGVNPDATPSEEHSRNVEDIPINDFFYKFVVPPLGGIYSSMEPVGDLAWLQDGGEFIEFGWSFTGEQFGESTYFYELAVTPIWGLPRENATPENTEFMDLEENDVVHLSIAMGDLESGDEYQGFWTLTAEGSNTSVTDFIATPPDPALGEPTTAVEGTTWGAIKAGFIE
jgi:hypothetical protein